MSETKHTPGPWIAKGEGGKYVNKKNTWTVQDENRSWSIAAPITIKGGKIIAFAVHSQNGYDSQVPQLEENARLIAAAPDLLEALHACVMQITALCSRDDVPDQAFAAIAKAQGHAHD